MKRFMLAMLLFALPASAQSLTPEAAKSAAADAPTKEVLAAQSVVQAKLLTPLSQKESARMRFSRVARPTPVMRVRVTDPQPQKDHNGRAYMTFAVDSCRGFIRNDNCWQSGTIAGCVYPTSGQVFVQRGDLYFPVEIMLGQNVESTANVCQAPPPVRST